MQAWRYAVWLAGGLISATSLAVATAPSMPPGTPIELELGLIRSGLEQIKNNNLKAASKTLQRAVEAPVFGDLQPVQQHFALQLAGSLALSANDLPLGAAYLKRSSAMPMADAQDWYPLLVSAYALQDYPTATECVIALARHWPQALENIQSNVIYQLDSEAAKLPADDETRLQLLSALQSIHWKASSGREPAALWRDLALMLSDRGDAAAAEKVAMGIDDAGVLLTMRVDKRFDRIVSTHRGHFDIPAALDREIASIEADIEARPRRLEIQMELTYRLLRAGRFTDVVKLADGIQAQIAVQDSEHPAHDDADDYLQWILDSKARALKSLGRRDEALVILQDAAQRKEYGGANVSQSINLAFYQLELGKPQAALDAIHALGDPSAYGRLMAALVRHAAAVQLHDDAMRVESITYVREHRADAAQALFSAFCIEGKQDEAAAELQRQLADTDSRSAMLEIIQQYRTLPRTPIDAAFRAQIEAVIARKDVREAIERVGRIERFDIFEPIT